MSKKKPATMSGSQSNGSGSAMQQVNSTNSHTKSSGESAKTKISQANGK